MPVAHQTLKVTVIKYDPLSDGYLRQVFFNQKNPVDYADFIHDPLPPNLDALSYFEVALLDRHEEVITCAVEKISRDRILPGHLPFKDCPPKLRQRYAGDQVRRLFISGGYSPKTLAHIVGQMSLPELQQVRRAYEDASYHFSEPNQKQAQHVMQAVATQIIRLHSLQAAKQR